LDTVARVLAEYYHLKTDTQLAALDEALSKVPAVSVGGGHEKDHVADPGKMVEDLISRRAAIDALKQQAETMSQWSNRYAEQRKGVLTAVNIVEDLPSAQPEVDCSKCVFCGFAGFKQFQTAQPEERTEERTETHACDTIYRQAAIDTLAEWHDAAITNRLNNLPSAQPVAKDINVHVKHPGWIPCSERLPKVREWVLCQCRAGIMDVLRLTDDNDWNKDSTHIYMHSFVVAWMPLPEPWKGEQHGTSRAVLSQKPMR
jgi:hypothetical protein